MLTSSSAKWKCLWYLFIWSIQITLVSQFLHMENHVAFFVFATVSILGLPLVTSVYSNTYGRKGSGMLRFFLVFCDPVLACLTIIPSNLLNHLPVIAQQYYCLLDPAARLTWGGVRKDFAPDWNLTYECLVNKTRENMMYSIEGVGPSEVGFQEVLANTRAQFLTIEGSLMAPVLLVLLMGRRTVKMGYPTFLLSFCYWLLIVLELVNLLEVMFLCSSYETLIFTTETLVSIVLIITNSYSIVTLCSYVSPLGKGMFKLTNSFDTIYQLFVAIAGALFVEVPLLIVRFQLLVSFQRQLLSGTFFCWMIKDLCMLGILCMFVYLKRTGSQRRQLCLPCAPMKSDVEGGVRLNRDLFFQPEKRDRYIRRVRQYQQMHPDSPSPTSSMLGSEGPDMTDFDVPTFEEETPEGLKRHKSAPNITIEKSAETKVQIRENSTSLTDLRNLRGKPCHLAFLKSLGRVKPKAKAKKSVKFKLDLGMGRFLETHPRSDSPPVFKCQDPSLTLWQCPDELSGANGHIEKC